MNLRSIVGKKNASKLGKIANKSIIAEKLKIYFNLLSYGFSISSLPDVHDHTLPIYSIRKIDTEKYSKY
tara:strand:+ start:138 stop:344 length:207 start_codon:yes stop_codon:yes gene_type:complete